MEGPKNLATHVIANYYYVFDVKVASCCEHQSQKSYKKQHVYIKVPLFKIAES